MPQYILICDHPILFPDHDVPDGPGIIRDERHHEIAARDDEEALRWVRDHKKEEVHCFDPDETATPRPLRLARVIKEWQVETGILIPWPK